jgi:hypothetical protein
MELCEDEMDNKKLLPDAKGGCMFCGCHGILLTYRPIFPSPNYSNAGMPHLSRTSAGL